MRTKTKEAERDKTHMEQVERWARFVRDNPRRVWKKEQAALVNSQIAIANRFYRRLEKTAGGREKIRRLRRQKHVQKGQTESRAVTSIQKEIGRLAGK
jgi:hypothetical protein